MSVRTNRAALCIIDMETLMKRILAASALVALSDLATFPAVAATTTTTTTKTTTAAKPAPVVSTPAKPIVLSFKLVDANHDGKISYEELKKYFPKLTKTEFTKADTKTLGYLDHAEFAAFVKSQQPPKTPMAAMSKAK